MATCGPLHVLKNIKQLKFLTPTIFHPFFSSPTLSVLLLRGDCWFTQLLTISPLREARRTLLPLFFSLTPPWQSPLLDNSSPGFLSAARWLSTVGELVSHTRNKFLIFSLMFLTDLVPLIPWQGTGTYLFLCVLKFHTASLWGTESPAQSAGQTRTWKQTCCHHSLLFRWWKLLGAVSTEIEIQVQTHHFPSKHVTDTKTKPHFKIISSASVVNYLLFNSLEEETHCIWERKAVRNASRKHSIF